MFLLKTKCNNFIKDINLNKRNNFFKLITLILGMYIFSIGIILTANTASGVSMIDVTVLAGLFHSEGLIDTTNPEWNNVQPGTVFAGEGSPYELYVAFIYIGMSVVSITFMAIWVSKEYKKSGDKTLFIFMGLSIVGDIIVILAVPYLIKMNLLYIDVDGITNAKASIRAYLFLVGFASYALGIAFWVYSGFLPGPYNNIATNFLKLCEGKSYTYGRTMMNILIFIPGILVLLIDGIIGHRTWNEVLDFILVNISFGTVFLILLLGPQVTVFKKLITKVLPMKPHIEVNQPVQVSLNLEEL